MRLLTLAVKCTFSDKYWLLINTQIFALRISFIISLVKGFSYGPLRFEAETAKITIGKLKCEAYTPATTPRGQSMKTMVEEQQIAINSLINRVNKLEKQGKGRLFLLCYEIRQIPDSGPPE